MHNHCVIPIRAAEVATLSPSAATGSAGWDERERRRAMSENFRINGADVAMTLRDVGVGRGARPTLRKLSFVVVNPHRTPPRAALDGAEAALDGTEIGAPFRRSWLLRNGPRESRRPRGVRRSAGTAELEPAQGTTTRERMNCVFEHRASGIHNPDSRRDCCTKAMMLGKRCCSSVSSNLAADRVRPMSNGPA